MFQKIATVILTMLFIFSMGYFLYWQFGVFGDVTIYGFKIEKHGIGPRCLIPDSTDDYCYGAMKVVME